jgi:hypothetical protein
MGWWVCGAWGVGAGAGAGWGGELAGARVLHKRGLLPRAPGAWQGRVPLVLHGAGRGAAAGWRRPGRLGRLRPARRAGRPLRLAAAGMQPAGPSLAWPPPRAPARVLAQGVLLAEVLPLVGRRVGPQVLLQMRQVAVEAAAVRRHDRVAQRGDCGRRARRRAVSEPGAQAAGGGAQAAGGRRQAAGGRRQAAGGRRQAAGGRRQAAGVMGQGGLRADL